MTNSSWSRKIFQCIVFFSSHFNQSFIHSYSHSEIFIDSTHRSEGWIQGGSVGGCCAPHSHEHVQCTQIYRAIPSERQLWANWMAPVQQARERDYTGQVWESPGSPKVEGTTQDLRSWWVPLFPSPLNVESGQELHPASLANQQDTVAHPSSHPSWS